MAGQSRFLLAMRQRLAQQAATSPMQTLLASAPVVGDDAPQAAAIAAKRRQRMAANAMAPATRGGTLLTGPAGLTNAAPVQRATLLGS